MISPDEMEDLLDEMYNNFTPTPLQPGDPRYVDCRSVRGDEDVVKDLGRTVRRSQAFTYQLYSGHRGSGKTTELLRLKKDLEDRHHKVVYFAADEEDLSVQDAQYTDILLACTRHLLEELKNADSQPILSWLQDRLQDLKEVMLMEIKVDQLNLEVGLQMFAKLTAAVRMEPGQRQKIRELVEPHTETLIEALNAFIADGKQHLPEKTKLLVIADNLDRIVPIFQENGRSNHEEIFLDRNEQLKALNCHIVYTVPISFIYSRWATELHVNYGIPQVLPSIMVRQKNNDPDDKGLEILRNLIKRRVPERLRDNFVPEVFESEQIFRQLCLMSGGYVRDFIQLMQEAIKKTDTLPIQARAVQRATDNLRDVYRRAVEANQWEILREVHQSKDIENDPIERSLLFNRCLLEYRYFDEKGDKQTWYDVHPVLWKELE
ncbi:P-loop NTPase fold protein [Roseofilum capinflatum]|uniref:AAA family ATPase n=1 Tax=Roseofilum capinflatum BLCC-M114 TaxID=3022440 RepID=A0ABT7BCS3_9CYAN|nr:P-loop NTPase fold protein [Roseofilum capinflatum]MDJ1176093.1 AAA family ATPase [Roseofilum capinflatum BLCC-M114]